MTAAEWDACSDPDRMLAAADGRLTDRKLLLFACGCARRVWDRLPDRARAAVPMVEQAADAASVEERTAGVREAMTAAVGGLAGAAFLLFRPHLSGAYFVRPVASYLRTLEPPTPADADDAGLTRFGLLFPFGDPRPSPLQADVLRCVAGNPFRRPRFRPAWRTSDAVALAVGVYADDAFDRLPILADALQDASCGHDHLLAHLRSDGPHTRGCWAVDVVLGKT